MLIFFAPLFTIFQIVYLVQQFFAWFCGAKTLGGKPTQSVGKLAQSERMWKVVYAQVCLELLTWKKLKKPERLCKKYRGCIRKMLTQLSQSWTFEVLAYAPWFQFSSWPFNSFQTKTQLASVTSLWTLVLWCWRFLFIWSDMHWIRPRPGEALLIWPC